MKIGYPMRIRWSCMSKQNSNMRVAEMVAQEITAKAIPSPIGFACRVKASEPAARKTNGNKEYPSTLKVVYNST